MSSRALQTMGIVGANGSGWASAAQALDVNTLWTVCSQPYERYHLNFSDHHRVIDTIDAQTPPVDVLIIAVDDGIGASDTIRSVASLRELPKLVIIESVESSRSRLGTISRPLSKSWRSANRLAGRLSSQGYSVAAYWSNHGSLGATASRSRWTAQLAREPLLPRTGVLPMASHPGWFDRLYDLLEPLSRDCFEPADLAPWQRERMARSTWPHGVDETLMLHGSYTGSRLQRKTDMARKATDLAYAPHAGQASRYRATRIVHAGRTLRMLPRAVARVCDFSDDWHLPRSEAEAMRMLARATSPVAAVAHLIPHLYADPSRIMDSPVSPTDDPRQTTLSFSLTP